MLQDGESLLQSIPDLVRTSSWHSRRYESLDLHRIIKVLQFCLQYTQLVIEGCSQDVRRTMIVRHPMTLFVDLLSGSKISLGIFEIGEGVNQTARLVSDVVIR